MTIWSSVQILSSSLIIWARNPCHAVWRLCIIWISKTLTSHLNIFLVVHNVVVWSALHLAILQNLRLLQCYILILHIWLVLSSVDSRSREKVFSICFILLHKGICITTVALRNLQMIIYRSNRILLILSVWILQRKDIFLVAIT